MRLRTGWPVCAASDRVAYTAHTRRQEYDEGIHIGKLLKYSLAILLYLPFSAEVDDNCFKET